MKKEQIKIQNKNSKVISPPYDSEMARKSSYGPEKDLSAYRSNDHGTANDEAGNNLFYL
jgi:hypothetical protein